ncbi:PDR/VanB family oxidoreductase [Undibacter mobilis]|uniref:Oxidoreductase n=1 Tax=Undibacter mobilis TaxID=2292256 RepID=A0A371BE66_9BRAD|nr:PDR/VanB family oxidoreductase [Undibacter mobilis]RDV05798.1 oxidoreductase [Undibacter mobilis]
MTAAESNELELVLDSVVGETADVLVLELKRPDATALPAWAPGAHVDLVLPSGKIRQYSLCGDIADTSRYRVAVLRETAGRGGSEEIHAIAKSGLTVRVRGPRNHFALVEAPRYLFVAGGIGVTPILPMIRQAELAGRPWRLVYGGRTRASMGFVKEIAARTGGTVTLLPQDEVGLPDLNALLSEVELDAAIYGCGPAGMLKALKDAAAQHGRASALHIESFSASEDAVPPAGGAGDAAFEVELRKSGVVLQVPADRSLGTVLQDAGIEVPFSCQEGYCGSCETRVLEGVPDHRDTILTEEERAVGNIMMVCCGRSRTPRLVLDL